MIEFGHGTHRGLRRQINEDTYYADSGTGLFLVADGMGGRDRGDRVAAAARDCVAAGVCRDETLHTAMQNASRCVAEPCPRSRTNTTPVGTTLAALHVSGNSFDMAWVGDSRIYAWHTGNWYELTRTPERMTPLMDPARARATATADTNPPAAAATSEPGRRRTLTQALGVTPPAELDVRTLQGHCVAGMRFLICSDGLSEHVSNASMSTLIARDDLGAQECVDQLIRLSLDAGSDDNITAIIVRIC